MLFWWAWWVGFVAVMLAAWVAVLRLVVFDCYSLVGLLLLVLDGLVVDLVFVDLVGVL